MKKCRKSIGNRHRLHNQKRSRWLEVLAHVPVFTVSTVAGDFDAIGFDEKRAHVLPYLVHFHRARCPIEVVANRLELNAFVSHQRLSGKRNRNFSETLRATAWTEYRKPNDGFPHGRAPKNCCLLPRDTEIRIYG